MVDFEGLFRHYITGWRPRFTHDYDYRSTIRDIGEGSSKTKRYGYRRREEEEPQTYEDIKETYSANGELWEDPDFPAEDKSIFFKKPPSCWPNIEWLRPHEICDNPKFLHEGASRMDINQGALGDCWFLAAVACLTQNEALFHRVVPDDQDFLNSYAGIFRFQFWQYGRWVEVIIDDRLPTSNGRLIYLHSNEGNEFWPAMLEKAYAKLNGSYESLSGGLTGEALVDFTGGIIEKWNFPEDGTEGLYERMKTSLKKGGFMACSIDSSPDTMESRLENGLVIGHAYSITDVRNVTVETPTVSGQIAMIRIRNPWGNEAEWKGAWSDGSPEWEYIPEEERQNIGLTFEADGEFWMSFDDFSNNFQRMEICHLGPDSIPEGEGVKWEMSLMEGSWKRNINAGGCANYKSHALNPAYKITLDEADGEDEEGRICLLLGVMQKERRKKRMEGEADLPIGYAIYKMNDPDEKLSYKSLRYLERVAGSKSFINSREVADYHFLYPGSYAVVPSTFEPQQEADFLLRLFAEKPGTIEEPDEITGKGEPDPDEVKDETAEEKTIVAIEAFRAAAGYDNEIDAYELMNLLNTVAKQEFDFEGFNVDICRSMVAMRDINLTGTLGFDEFKGLWDDLLKWIVRKKYNIILSNNFFLM
ncbi:DgyrCDS2268 [Dimorphilus gyrociliatus]|uniref:DgyrCDS2268 n=1 Tax=Dimorphilus gyrociliatus TaxID=2664684 RepID=A0A7I8VB26_9ANNE|nr:DgyrCDS2268 [Dimorphilus gyrociliatus]